MNVEDKIRLIEDYAKKLSALIDSTRLVEEEIATDEFKAIVKKLPEDQKRRIRKAQKEIRGLMENCKECVVRNLECLIDVYYKKETE